MPDAHSYQLAYLLQWHDPRPGKIINYSPLWVITYFSSTNYKKKQKQMCRSIIQRWSVSIYLQLCIALLKDKFTLKNKNTTCTFFSCKKVCIYLFQQVGLHHITLLRTCNFAIYRLIRAKLLLTPINFNHLMLTAFKCLQDIGLAPGHSGPTDVNASFLPFVYTYVHLGIVFTSVALQSIT